MSGFAHLLSSSGPSTKALPSPPLVAAPPSPSNIPPWEFIVEFVQVMADKVLLAGIFIYLYHAGADPKLYMPFLGALLYSLQSRRFKNRG